MLRERRTQFVVSTLGRQKGFEDLPVKWLIPFDIPKLDRYQRLLVYFSAKRFPNSVFLNMTGIPIPLSRYGTHVIYAGAAPFNVTPKYNSSPIWRLYRLPFLIALNRLKEESKNALFVANSKYSAETLRGVYGVESEVIYPPIDVDDFGKAFHEGGNYFITVARIERGKQLERTIEIASLSGIRGIVVGYLSEPAYLKRLRKLSEEKGKLVGFLPNLSRDELIEVMKGACCYFHPTTGEHFGVPVVEAMAAGLPPVVPKESGAAEAWNHFTYTTIEEAAEKLKQARDVDRNYRKSLMEEASKYSSKRFKEEFWNYLCNKGLAQ